MRVLGIETSCDETAAAVLEGDAASAASGTAGWRLRSNVVASQVADHAPYGGVLPELASRCHLEAIGPVVERALAEAGTGLDGLDGIAVTRGPGLVGSLLVGVCYAKAMAFARGLPVVGVNHIEAHVAAVGLEHAEIRYPALALVVSGGHTALYLQAGPDDLRLLGQTRDDAVGEAFDKVGKLLGLPYPGGPAIDRLARAQPGRGTKLPRVRVSDGSLDFSFSGLKSAVARIVRDGALAAAAGRSSVAVGPGVVPETQAEIARGFQEAAVDALLHNVERAIADRRPRSLLLAGGVACNSLLRRRAQELGERLGVAVHLPSPALSTDNGAMIAVLGARRLAAGLRDGMELDADPALVAGTGLPPAPPPGWGSNDAWPGRTTSSAAGALSSPERSPR